MTLTDPKLVFKLTAFLKSIIIIINSIYIAQSRYKAANVR